MTNEEKQANLTPLSIKRITELAEGKHAVLGDLQRLAITALSYFDENKSTVKAFQSVGFCLLEREQELEAMEQRAEAAEAKLAELEKQKPIGRVDRGAATDSNEYPDARVVCLHEHVGWEAFQDGCELFTRPAPAVSLAPVSNCLSFFASVIKSGESWSATCQRDLDSARETLRNIEEAK